MLRLKLLATFVVFLVSASFAQNPAPVPCDKNPVYQKLDFWLGDWDVYDLKSGAVTLTTERQ